MNVPGFMTAGHIKYKGVNVMKNKKKTAGILLLTCILGAVLIFVPKYIFTAVKTSMDTYSNKKEALKEDHWIDPGYWYMPLKFPQFHHVRQP